LLRDGRHLLLAEARQQLITDSQVIDRSRYDYRGILCVFFYYSLKSIEVRVPGVGPILNGVLRRSYSWKPRSIEGCVIGSAEPPALGVYGSYHSYIFEWSDHCAQDRSSFGWTED
jgi:hypothetical protein